MEKKTYIGPYKVYKVYRVSRRKEVIRRGLTRDEAISLAHSYPTRKNSMVVFDKQFWADKYFV